jgi:hypothetical protein
VLLKNAKDGFIKHTSGKKQRTDKWFRNMFNFIKSKNTKNNMSVIVIKTTEAADILNASVYMEFLQ